MKKFFIGLGYLVGTLVFALASINVINAYRYLYEISKDKENMLAAIKKECPGVAKSHEYNRAPAEKDIHLICGDKELRVDVEGQYASWFWADDRKHSVIYMPTQEDVSELYHTALKIWQKTEEYPEKSALIIHNHFENRLVESSLKEFEIRDASEILTFGSEEKDILIKFKECKKAEKKSFYCQRLLEDSKDYFTFNYGR